MKRLFVDQGGYLRFGWIFAIVAGIVGALILVLILTITQIDRHLVATKCEKRAEILNRETRFVSYTFFDYECLVRNDDGSYVSEEHLTDRNPVQPIEITDGRS